MVELTARVQFLAIDYLKDKGTGFLVIFNSSHTPFLKPLVDGEFRWIPEGDIRKGLVLKNTSTRGVRLLPYNREGRYMKAQFQLSPANGVSVQQPPTSMITLKVVWDADKKQFSLPPIDPAKLPVREKKVQHHKKHYRKTTVDLTKTDLKKLDLPSDTPFDELRTHIRAMNELADSLGIELAVAEGKIRALLTFE